MRINNKKIDYILKLTFYMLPIIYIFICAIATESAGLVSFTNQLNEFFEGVSSGIFEDFSNWFINNITTSNGVLLVLYYSFYIVFVEFVILFKNILTWLFKVANSLIERSFINE